MSFNAPLPTDNSHVVIDANEFRQISALAEFAREHFPVLSQSSSGIPTNYENSASPDTPCQQPDFFDGSRHKTKVFTSQLKLYFLAKKSQFPDYISKITYACSLLREEAFSWFQTLQEDPTSPFPSNFQNYANFEEMLTSHFGDGNTREMAEKNILNLRQSTSVSEYANKFKLLSAQVDWNDSALCCHFYRGLKDRIKDEITKFERPKILKDLIDISIRIDNRLYERFLEKKSPSSEPRYQGSLSPQVFIPQASTTVQDPSPMEIDNLKKSRFTKLTAEEKERRRRLGLCMYCSGSGHTVATCHVRPKTSMRLSHTSRSIKSSHKAFVIPLKI